MSAIDLRRVVMATAALLIAGHAPLVFAESVEWSAANPGLMTRFGFRAVGIADQNGDGYSEVLTLGWGYVDPPTPNRVLMYYGGPSADGVADHEFTDDFERNYGWGLSAVGDFDGDGGVDFVVGAAPPQGPNSVVPAGFEFFRGGAALDEIPDIVVEYYDSSAGKLGVEVSGGGDLNGDGFDDFAVGAGVQWPEQPFGQVFVYLGSPSLDANPDLVLQGEVEGDGFGDTILLQSDYNGDGYDDLVVGASHHVVGEHGRVYIYFGGPVLDDAPDLVLQGAEIQTLFGEHVADGDVDGDGYDDLVVSEPGYDLAETDPSYVEEVSGTWNQGRIAVFLGGPGLDAIEDRTVTGITYVYRLSGPMAVVEDVPGPAAAVYAAAGHGVMRFDFSTLDPAFPDHFIPSPDPSEYTQFGFDVSRAIDFDGDGLQDVIISDLKQGIVRVYSDPSFDCDGDGVQNAAEIAGGTATDCNANGFPDECELQFWPGLDCTNDGVLDTCQLAGSDCDEDGQIDSCEIARFAWLDCDGNGVLDTCEALTLENDCDQSGVSDCREIYEDGALDCNRDGVIDGCQLSDLALDCDQNGEIDSCQLTWNPQQDCDRDGLPDTCQLGDLTRDCDENGFLDSCEIEDDATLDCDSEGSLDSCQLAYATYDRDADGEIDSCEIAAHSERDCDGDGVLDNVQLLDTPIQDCDADGNVDDCESPLPVPPCRSQPYVGVYFDASFNVSELAVGEVPLQGSLYVVVRGLDPSFVADVDVYEIAMQVPQGISTLVGSVHPATGFDVSPLPNDWYVLTNGTFAPDAQGDLLLVTVPFFSQAGQLAPNSRVTVSATLSNSASADGPVLHEALAGVIRLVDLRSAWIGRSFDDCNANQFDDLLDIASGFSADTNANLVPDECEATAAPPLPDALRLLGATPNPFNPRTSIRFEMPEAGAVELKIYDAAGRQIRGLLRESLGPGLHARSWDGTDDSGREVATGVYYLRLVVDGEVRTHRVALLR